MATVAEWFLALLLNGIQLVLCIIIIYTAFRFHRFRHEQALQKRHPFSVHLMSIFSILFNLQNQFYKLAFIYGVTDFDMNALKVRGNDTFYGNIYLLISTIFYVFSLHGLLILLLARSWTIYFNINWGLQIHKRKWSVHIDSNVSSFWFLKHRKDFGSDRFIYSVVISYYLLIGTILMILCLSNSNIDDLISLPLLLMLLISITVIWNKIPPFHDGFMIQLEMKYVLRVAMIGLALYIVWTLKTVIIGYHLWSFMLFQFMFGVIVALMSIIMNSYIFSDQHHHLLATRSTKPRRDLLNAAITDSIKTAYTLKHTLSKTELIEGYFKHLTDEFSVETLLAFIEFTQFYNTMRDDARFAVAMDQWNTNAKSMLHSVELTSDLPESQIIIHAQRNSENSTDPLHKYVVIAQKLYMKYVVHGSEFEINIGWSDKQQIDAFIHTYSEQSENVFNEAQRYELLMLFEVARETMYRLMSSSHFRFIQSNQNLIKRDHAHQKQNSNRLSVDMN